MPGKPTHEDQLRRINRALRMVIECNQILIKKTDEKELLAELCRIIVEIGGYHLAWVGFVQHDEKKTILPVAHCGYEDGYLDTLNITWADTERGRGPTGTAIRTGRPVICRDILSDPAFTPWRDDAVRRGYRSSIAVPLKADDESMGALSIYAEKTDAFDDEEAELLNNLGNELVYGITALRRRVEKEIAVKALRLSEEKFYKTFRASPDAITLTSLVDGCIVEVNDMGLRLTGYDRDEVIGRSTTELDYWADPADRERYIAMLQKDGRATALEADFRTKSGEIRTGLVSGEIIHLQNGPHILGVIRDITERKLAEDELRIINEELLAVNRIITTTTTTGVQGILESVLDEALSVTGLEGGTICMVTPDDTLHLAAHRATSEATIQDLTTNIVKIGDCLCGQCAQDRKPLILPDREAVLKFATREATRGEDIRFHAAFPLLAAEKCLGVLCVFTRTDKKPAERSLRLLETISSQIALAVENAQLYEETLRHSATLESKVKERTEALEENRKALINIVEDLNEKSEALIAANAKLQELDQLKSMFIASMSHELRTPLNSIIGFTGIILQGLSGEINAEQRDQLKRVYRSGKHLLALINDVIDISKIEAGKIDIRLEKFELNDVIQEAVSTLKSEIKEKGLDLSVSIPPGLTLRTDRKRLLQCILNYLSNAVKFTESGGIALNAREFDNSVEMTVADTGIGIEEKDMSKIFKPFVRLDSPLRTVTLGTGLGLHLTNKLATEALQGSVSVKSRLGEGSTFFIKIPKDVELLK